MSSKKVKEIFGKKIFRGEIKFDQPMSAYTSLKIGGPVEAMVFPEDVVSLKNVLIEAKKESIPIFVLGAGTNLLVKDSGIDGIAVCLKAFKRIEVLQNINEIAGRFFSKEVLGTSAGFFVEAGVPLGSLINFAKKNGYSGIEALAGIPGTFGGAVSMNAGSFGVEIKDVIISIALMNMDGRIEILEKDRFKFSYRSLNISGDNIIISANIILKKDIPENVSARITEFLKRKKSSQPIDGYSAGCVFKNPEGDFAGRLIEASGCKGMRAGDVEVSSAHANYFVNKGKATGRDFIELMETVKRRVNEQSGVTLEPEIKIIGKDG
ncbi:MAG: UDP-N-acetylmuramate dehydrogenase [Thermodesulfovibrionia bacterium]|nr:UDP-N-acetylmuramate dehydrogenase [Thermodesulfovibrionia bacterium]